jgi:hypothetical protein
VGGVADEKGCLSEAVSKPVGIPVSPGAGKQAENGRARVGREHGGPRGVARARRRGRRKGGYLSAGRGEAENERARGAGERARWVERSRARAVVCVWGVAWSDGKVGKDGKMGREHGGSRGVARAWGGGAGTGRMFGKLRKEKTRWVEGSSAVGRKWGMTGSEIGSVWLEVDRRPPTPRRTAQRVRRCPKSVSPSTFHDTCVPGVPVVSAATPRFSRRTLIHSGIGLSKTRAVTSL